MPTLTCKDYQFCRRHWLINVARELTGTSTGSRLSVQISNIPPGSKDTVLSLASRFSRDVTGSYSELVGPVKGRTENATLSFEHSQLREAFSSDIMARVPGCTVTPVKRVQGMEVCSLLDDMSRTVCISLRGQSPEGPLKSLEMALPTLIADIVGYSVLSSSGPGERILALFTTRAKTEKALSEITCLIDRDERHAIFHVEWGTTRFQRWVEAAYNVTKRGRVQSKVSQLLTKTKALWLIIETMVNLRLCPYLMSIGTKHNP